MSVDFTDCQEIKDRLTDEERKVYDDVTNVFKHNVLSTKVLNIIFAIILLYACFALLPVWVAASLIGIKLAIPVAKLIHIVYATIKLNKKYENFIKIINSIRLKIDNLEKNDSSNDEEDSDKTIKLNKNVSKFA